MYCNKLLFYFLVLRHLIMFLILKKWITIPNMIILIKKKNNEIQFDINCFLFYTTIKWFKLYFITIKIYTH